MQPPKVLCVGDRELWDTGLGGCATYALDNAIFCTVPAYGFEPRSSPLMPTTVAIEAWRVCEECHLCSGQDPAATGVWPPPGIVDVETVTYELVVLVCAVILYCVTLGPCSNVLV